MVKSVAPSKGEITRTRIVDAAYALFLEQGFHGTSMRQVVAAAGITMGGIYNHFPSKEELWKAILLEKHPYREVIASIEHSQGDTVADFVRNAAAGIITTLGDRPDALKLMFIEMVEFGGRDVPLLFDATTPRLAQLLTRMESLTGRRRPLPLTLIARVFAGLVFSFHVTNLFLPATAQQPTGERALDGFVEIFLHGILEPEEGERHD